jgi:hypothetical protein
VLSLSSLIDFLLDMLRDDATQAEFARDPSSTLAARGLADVTAQDVRDVQPMLADVGGVQRVGHDTGGPAAAVRHHGGHDGGHDGGHGGGYGGGHGGGPDVVREIHQVTREFVVSRPVTHVTQEHNTYNSFTEFRTDNSVYAGDGATVVQNSFNQDNDGVDNKGGTIEESTVGGGNVTDSGNEIEQTTVTGSGNDSHDEVTTDSYNTTATQEWEDVANTGDDDPEPPTIAYGEPYSSGGDTFASGTVNDSYSVQSVSTPAADAGDLVGAEQP